VLEESILFRMQVVIALENVCFRSKISTSYLFFRLGRMEMYFVYAFFDLGFLTDEFFYRLWQNPLGPA